MRADRPNAQSGFSLVEMIIGIVLFAVAMAVLTNVFAPQVKQSIDPIWQTRAATLAKSLLDEINARAFDEVQSQPDATERCNESVACTTSAGLGPEVGESRADFDDVDDYHGLVANGSAIFGSGSQLTYLGQDVYSGFEARVSVFYDANLDGVNDDDVDNNSVLDTGTLTGNRKLIQVTIITPGNETLSFISVKDNY